LLLDVIEHLTSPEAFAAQLRDARAGDHDPVVIVSTGNVAFVVVRLMLLLGFFHCGPRGIPDLTHRRLFTFSTLCNLFQQAGYQIDEMQGVPFPFPLVLGDSRLSRWAWRVNRCLPTLDWLLAQAVAATDVRRQSVTVSGTAG
jgi:hypothetical protein